MQSASLQVQRYNTQLYFLLPFPIKLCTSNTLQLVQILFASAARLRTINPIFFVSREASDSTLNFERNFFIQEKKSHFPFCFENPIRAYGEASRKKRSKPHSERNYSYVVSVWGISISLLLFSVFSTVRPLMTVFTQLPAATAESFGLILAKDGERD